MKNSNHIFWIVRLILKEQQNCIYKRNFTVSYCNGHALAYSSIIYCKRVNMVTLNTYELEHRVTNGILWKLQRILEAPFLAHN